MTKEKGDKELILSIRKYSSESFDKHLVYLNGGTLGVSFIYIKDIVNFENSSFNWILFVSWFFLSSSLVIHLFSHYSAVKTTDFWLDSKGELYKKWNTITSTLNFATIILFMGGILLLLFFVFLNIKL